MYHNIQLNSYYIAPYLGDYTLANEMTSSDAFINNGMKCKIVGTYKLKSGRKTSALLGENKTIAKVFNMNTFVTSENTRYSGYDYQKYDFDGKRENDFFWCDISDNQTLFDFSNDLTLLSGTHPKQKNDIVVSKNTGYGIGETISVGYGYAGTKILQQFKVVGISNSFSSRDFEVNKDYFIEAAASYGGYADYFRGHYSDYAQVVFKTNNPQDIEKKYNITLISSKDYVLSNSSYSDTLYYIDRKSVV